MSLLTMEIRSKFTYFLILVVICAAAFTYLCETTTDQLNKYCLTNCEKPLTNK